MSTGDLKRRRLSGRHQISEGGKHLVDGVAFGRPWLRVPRDRPSVELPPRKRARLTLEEQEDDNDDEGLLEPDLDRALLEAPQLATFSGHNSTQVAGLLESLACDLEEDDDDDDGDVGFEPVTDLARLSDTDDASSDSSDGFSNADAGELDEELDFLRQDNAIVDDGAEPDVYSIITPDKILTLPSVAPESRKKMIIDDPDAIALEALKLAWPHVSEHGIQVALDVAEGDVEEAYDILSDQGDPQLSLDEMLFFTSLSDVARDAFKAQADAARCLLKRPRSKDDQDVLGSLALEDDRGLRGLDQMFAEPDISHEPIGKGSVAQALDAFQEAKVKKAEARAPLIQVIESHSRPDELQDSSLKILASGSGKAASTVIAQIGNDEDSDATSSSGSSSESDSSDDDAASEGSVSNDESSDTSDEGSDSSDDESGFGAALDLAADASMSDEDDVGDADEAPPDGTDPNEFEGISDEDSSSSEDEATTDAPDAATLNALRALTPVSQEDEEHNSDTSSSEASSDSSDDSSSSESESGSDSDSEPEEAPTKEISKPGKKSPPPSKPAGAHPSTLLPIPRPPSTTLTRTQKRNARRREQKLRKRVEDQVAAQTDSDSALALSEELLARKAALLGAMEYDGDEIAQEVSAPKENLGKVAKPERNVAQPSEPLVEKMDVDLSSLQVVYEPSDHKDTSEALSAGVLDRPESPLSIPQSGVDSSTASQRRARLDVGAGKRLLFGALGLKPPKSKADEQKLREKLMQGVRPLQNARIPTEIEADQTVIPPADEEVDEDPDAWREKIIYRAVECCKEGVELSEPPFPFVQRWDPQQKYKNRKQKRKLQDFEETNDWYQESFNTGLEEMIVDSSQKQKMSSEENLAYGNSGTNKIGVPTVAKGPGSQFTDYDDLPSLPSDITSLPLLEAGSVEPGMVITWNQLKLSKATNWQPQLSPVTALVIGTKPDEPHDLNVMLAVRDREEDDKIYDEVTGERIYGKFEVPDMDEDEKEDDLKDDGHRQVEWSEMIEPRIVQREPSGSALNTPSKITQATLGGSYLTKPNDLPANETQVSEGQEPGDSAIEGVTTQAVMAGVLTDLGLSDGKDLTETSQDVSIKSGQHGTEEELPSIKMSNSAEAEDADVARGSVADSDVDNSPGRQLVENMKEAELAVQDDLQAHDDGNAASDIIDAIDGEPDVAIDGSDAHAHWELEATPPGAQASCKHEAQTHSNQVVRRTPPVEYPDLIVPSSILSVHSEQRHQADYDEEMLPDASGDSFIPETGRNEEDITPTPRRSNSLMSFTNESSPMASLEDIFLTAKTSRQTQSPGRSTQQSTLAALKGTGDTEYDELMRKLDDGDDSDVLPNKNQSIRGLFPNATQPVQSTSSPPARQRPRASSRSDSPFRTPRPQSRIVKLKFKPEPKISPPPLRNTAAATAAAATSRKKPSFMIPQGSQVISIDSSSPEPSEQYADDDMDDTFSPQSGGGGGGRGKGGGQMPTGPGWVRKFDTRARTASGSREPPPLSSSQAYLRSQRGSSGRAKSLPAIRKGRVDKGKNRIYA